MRIFIINDQYTILKGIKSAEPKFREALSKLIIEKFGKGPYPQEIITNILFFSKDYYVNEFEKICNAEASYTFYKEVIWLNEQATALRHSESYNVLPAGIDKDYISEYRRILKMIIEQGCLVKMSTGEKRNKTFIKRISPILNDLFFLGTMLFGCSESIGEQYMVEDITDITFDKKNCYVFGRRHHYGVIFQYVQEKMSNLEGKYIIDEAGTVDFKTAVKEAFNIDYDKVLEVIGYFLGNFKLQPGDCLSAHKNSFIKDISRYTKVSISIVKQFMAGLSLSKKNKLPLSELLNKPHSLNRYLSRPFLIWTIGKKEFFVFGTFSLHEAESTLYLNSIPWGKMPCEWENNLAFKKYVNKKCDAHDKWLDDKVEVDIISSGLMYQRSVKKIVTKKKVYPITGKNLGEIDFIIICEVLKLILVVDCKHLTGRYDMVNWRNDYDHFTVDGKKQSYNTKLTNKVAWLSKNKKLLEEHFQIKYQSSAISFDEYAIEGVFFINTPTFYMYNSDLRIYTFDQVKDVISGKHIDPTFSYFVEEEDHQIYYTIKYPYFRKPTLIYYEDFDEGGAVDKFGDPLK